MKSSVLYEGSNFCELEDLKSISKTVRCKDEKFSAGGVTIYSDTEEAYILNHDAHTIAFGSTGSMKTLRYILPTIVNLVKHSESAIINDPKGEIYKKLKSFLENENYTVYILNFQNPQTGSRWEPFSIPNKLWKKGLVDKSDTYLRDIAKCIYSELQATTNDAFWANSAIDYFTGLAQIVRDESNGEALTMENILFTNSVGGEKFLGGNYLKRYFDESDKLSACAMNIQGTVLAPNDTRESIRSVFSQPLSLYGQEGIRDMMCESDFDITELGRKKAIVFIISPAERSVFNPIISAFIKQSYSALIDLVASEQPDGKTPVRVNFVLDEFSNLVRIEDFNQMITMARGANIRFNLVVQSISQLNKAYSADEAETIINNCEAWFVFRSNDRILHQIVTAMCGTRIEENSHEEHPLISSVDIQKLSKERGEVLLKVLGIDPFITTLPAIFEYPYNLPESKGDIFEVREKKERKIFDIRTIVQERYESKKQQALNGLEISLGVDPSSTSPIGNIGETNIDNLISCLDAKIAELEAEEKASNELDPSTQDKE